MTRRIRMTVTAVFTFVLVPMLAVAAEGPAPSTRPTAEKWYLSPEYVEDPEHARMIARAQARAAALDEAGIDQLVEAVTVPNRREDDYWTLVVLEDRAVPALVRALSNPKFHAVTAPYPSSPGFKSAGRLEALWDLMEPFAPADAVPALTKLFDHPDKPVRERAAMALGSIGHPSCAEPLRRALRSDDASDRSWALIGLGRGIGSGRANPQLLSEVFDDVAAVVDRPSVGGTDAPSVILDIDRVRATAFLVAPERFRADHGEIASIVRALARVEVVVRPAERVIALLDDLERAPRRETTAYGYGLKLLALTGDPSAAARIERAMAYDAPDDDLTRHAQYHRRLAADAYLALHGIPNAYQVAIRKWSGPGDLRRLAEAVRHYATVHVLNNEFRNGGVSQYFFNSYGEDVRAALAGLEAIGAKGAAKILRDAIAAFGNAGPSTDRAKRQRQLDELAPGAFEGLDDAWYDDLDHLDVLLARYAVRNKEHFIDQAPAAQP